MIAKLQSSDYVVKQLQENIVNPLNDLQNVLILNGTLLIADFVVGNNTINHGLGRLPKGWMVADKTASTDLYRTFWDNKKLVLNSSAISTIAVWVF